MSLITPISSGDEDIFGFSPPVLLSPFLSPPRIPIVPSPSIHSFVVMSLIVVALLAKAIWEAFCQAT